MAELKTHITFLLLGFFLSFVPCSLKADERIHVHTDRNLYISGETMFFSLYLYTQDSTQPSLSSVAYMLCRDAQENSVATLTMQVDNGVFYGSLYLNDTLPTGNYLLTVFTNSTKNSGRSACFDKWFTVVNRFDKLNGLLYLPVSETNTPLSPQISVSTGSSHYSPNDSIYVTISPSEAFAGKRLSLSLAINLHQPLLETDSAKSLVQNGSSELLIQKRFIPETSGKVLSGKVVNKTTGSGIPDCCVLLSAIDSLVNLKYCFTDKEGNFSFLMTDYYKQKTLTLRILQKILDPSWQLTVDDPFKHVTMSVPRLQMASEEQMQFVRLCRDLAHIHKIYGTGDAIERIPLKTAKSVCPLLYSKADYSIKPSQYQAFPDFIEIARNLLPSIRIRSQQGKLIIENTTSIAKGLKQTQPDIFLNGIYTQNPEQIIGLGSEQIDHIEVTDRQLVCGKLLFNSTLAIFTKEPVETSTYAPNVLIINTANEFIEPSVKKSALVAKHGLLPNFKNLLAWQAGVSLPKGDVFRFGFVASQLSGVYEIKVEGIADGERLVQASSFIIVKQQGIKKP